MILHGFKYYPQVGFCLMQCDPWFAKGAEDALSFGNRDTEGLTLPRFPNIQAQRAYLSGNNFSSKLLMNSQTKGACRQAQARPSSS